MFSGNGRAANEWARAKACAAAGAVALLATVSVGANAGVIVDHYQGGPDPGDVLGDARIFDVQSLEAYRHGHFLDVTVHTNFAGRAHEHLFANYTRTTTGQTKGIGYGDLFIASSWHPFGSAPYAQDTAINGTHWQYGFALDNRWAEGGSGDLFQLNGVFNTQNITLSDAYFSGANWRDHQAVSVKRSSAYVHDTGRNGVWSVDDPNNQVRFRIDVQGTALEHADTLALRWEMTCSNDAIEGQTRVPAPAALGLMALGLLGVGVRRRSADQ